MQQWLSKHLAVFSTARQLKQCRDLFEYTSGRWVWNDASRHYERRRSFNVSEFKRLAASAVQHQPDDVIGFEKLAEGGFNRSFLITMRDGFQFVARIPYPVTEPKPLLIASEVATIDYLRTHGIPVPRIFGYSGSADNPAGTEYIFMELVQGRNLGDLWYTLSERERHIIVRRIVQLETHLFFLRFPASGSLYYCDDLPVDAGRVLLPSSESPPRFCMGPDTSLKLWYGRRLGLSVDRGPYLNAVYALTAGAKKELAYLGKFGQDLKPIQRLRREVYSYQPQSYLEHVASLRKYLQIAPDLVPCDHAALTQPTIRHPDLQANNIFVSDDLDVTGVIDWQHSNVLDLFLQSGIPDSFQNYGDEISESLQTPTLPSDFDTLDEAEQSQQAELFRRRQLHYLYVKSTAEMNSSHYGAIADNFNTLRRRLFHHASDPWEGDNITLKADLITLSRSWTRFSPTTAGQCQISFSEAEVVESMRLFEAQSEADEQFHACQEVIGVGSEGWVPTAYYEQAKRCERRLKADSLNAAETPDEKKTHRGQLDF